MGATATQDPQVQANVEPAQSVQEDYFSFDETFRVVLPDGKSFVEHKALNEGAKRLYLNKQNRELKMHRGGDASINMAPGDERHVLLEQAVCGWNLMRGGTPVPFSEHNLREFLKTANPKIVDLVEKDVRLHNPWLLAEMSVEDIDKEIETLQEMRETKVREEEGKVG